MAVKIRLSRIGTKNVPFHRIVAIDERKKRDGAFLEDLGTYDAKTGKLITFRRDRIDAWISQGAIPSDVVKRLCKKHKDADKGATPAKPAQAVKKAKPEQEAKAE
jgi:small subunit ribosomal protein S16